MKRHQTDRTYRIVHPKPTRRRKRRGSLVPASVAFLALLGAFSMGHDKFEETREARKDAGYFGQRVVRVQQVAPQPDPMAEFVARKLAEADARKAVNRLTSNEPVRRAAKAEGIDPVILHGLVRTESGGNHKAVSSAGAVGFTQLMPETARELGVDPHDPQDNLRGGARYLKRMILRYGDRTLGLVAYNMGPGATDRWLARGGHWSQLPRETRDYIGKANLNMALAARN